MIDKTNSLDEAMKRLRETPIKRYNISSKYDAQTDLLTVEVTDTSRNKHSFAVKKLNGRDRTVAEEGLYETLGCENFLLIESMREMRSQCSLGDFRHYTDRGKAA